MRLESKVAFMIYSRCRMFDDSGLGELTILKTVETVSVAYS